MQLVCIASCQSPKTTIQIKEIKKGINDEISANKTREI